MAFSRLTTNTTTVGSSYFLIGGQGATLASASSITISDSFHEISGSTTINTINGGVAGMGLFLFRPVGASWAIGTSGNIKASNATPTDRAVLLVTPDGTTWYGEPASVSVASANTDITVSESGGVYTLTFNPANVSLDEFAGPVAISKGGTGQTTATAAFDALAPTTTTGDIIYNNGTDNVRLAVGASTSVLVGGTNPSYTSTPTVTTLNATTVNATNVVATGNVGAATGTTSSTFTATGQINANGGLRVKSTANAVTGIFSGVKAGHDFGTVTFGTVATTTLAITGVGTNDVVAVFPFQGSPYHVVSGYVSSGGTVTLTCANMDAATPRATGAQNYGVFVFSNS